MLSKLTGSIKKIIIILMVIAISLVLGISGAYQYKFEKQNKIAELNNLSERIADRLSENLVLPLWELDSNWVNTVINTEMTDKHIYAIFVTGEGDIDYRKGRDLSWNIVDLDDASNGDFIFNHRAIYHDDKKIGDVELVISKKFMGQELNSLATKQVISTLLLILLIIVLLVVGLDRILIQPINKFVKVAKAISEGDYSSKIDTYKQEELTSLAMSVRQMQVDIVKREQDLDLVNAELAKSNQMLEQRVEERTAALNKQHVFLETIMENIKDGIVACDEKGVLSLFNQATIQIHGIHEEDLPADKWAEHYSLFLADGKTVMKKDDIPLLKAFNGENIDGVEMVVKPKDSHARIVLASGQPMYDNKHNKLGAVISMHDITLRKQAENALKKAVDEAEKANHAKSVFLANMSHELRTPLNAIIGFSQLMKNSPNIPSDEGETVEIINRSGLHLLKLINDILDMSKIEAGQVTLEALDFDLGEMLRDVIDMMHLRALEKGLEIELDQSSQFPRFIFADAAKIRQIFINLLSNAVKFTEQGKVCLHLNVSDDPDDKETLILTCDVEDTGIGMDRDGLAHIFQPFHQLGHSFEQVGTGLGLAITRQFINMMGGEITVKSEVNKGSTFSFTIKVRRAKQGDSIAREEAETQSIIGLKAGQPKFRILIAEDQLESQLLLQRLLEPIGFQVKTANNGQEAVTIFQEWHPHLIWMDQRMPIMDGFEATRLIKAMPESDSTKIVTLTASVLGDQKQCAFKNGADDFLGKPYKIYEIFDCMAKHLGVHYIYKDDELDQDKAGDKQELTRKSLQGISDDLLETLSEVVFALDIEQTLDVIEQIAEENKDVAAELTTLVNNLDFEKLQYLLTNKEAGK